MFSEKVLTGRNFGEEVVQKRANWLGNVFLPGTNYFNYDLVVLIDVSVVVVNAQMAARFLATVAPSSVPFIPNSVVPRGQIAKCNCRHFPDDPGHHPSWAFFCHRPIHLYFQFI